MASPNHQADLADLTATINRLLDEQGITLLEAATRTGIARETFRRKASGAGRGFDAAEQKAIADLLGMKVSELWARAEGAAA